MTEEASNSDKVRQLPENADGTGTTENQIIGCESLITLCFHLVKILRDQPIKKILKVFLLKFK